MCKFDIPKRPEALKMLNVLQKRKQLSLEDQRELRVQRKGFEGERRFASLVKKCLPPDALVMYSVLLQIDNNYFQIDCLIILHDVVYLIDLKNYQGDYVFHNDGFQRLHSERKIKNPLHQLQRCEDLLHDFFSSFKIQRNIYSFIIFIHPTFTLYQASLHFNMIFPTQVRQFLEKINHAPPVNEDKKLAQLIKANHIKENPFEYQPEFQFQDLRKGLLCLQCSASMNVWGRTKLKCHRCGDVESISSGVLRSVIDFAVLFPEKKISVKSIDFWLNKTVAKPRIRRILQRFMKQLGKTKDTYYEFKFE